MKPFSNHGFARYAADLAAIAGRFALVAKSDESVTVGLIGKCNYADLNETQLRHIAEFYGAMPSPREFLTSYPAERNETMFTGFIRFEKKGESE